MDTKKLKEEIKKRVKELGYKLNREVSVRNCSGGYDTAFSIIFKINVSEEKLIEMKKKISEFSNIDRCEVTGEILSGGNTYIFIGVMKENGIISYPPIY